MHPDDLNVVWLCRECGRSFAFNSDVEDHKRQFGHSKMMLYDLQADTKKAPPILIRGRVSLDFRINGGVSQVIIDYEYYPSNDTLNYVDVRYTNNKLKSKVEGDPTMMRNIDSYLRRLLAQNPPA
ncbi:hypothetical protein [Candidatus Nitrososphaera gargensis]|nr:hypothetical protein [Candidatus Nitrososphaera gargensis]